jgi:hypothetical protein
MTCEFDDLINFVSVVSHKFLERADLEDALRFRLNASSNIEIEFYDFEFGVETCDPHRCRTDKCKPVLNLAMHGGCRPTPTHHLLPPRIIVQVRRYSRCGAVVRCFLARRCVQSTG